MDVEDQTSHVSTPAEQRLRVHNQGSSNIAKGVEHLNLMPLIADQDGQPNVDKAMGNIDRQIVESDREMERTIRESQKRFMLTEIPLNIAIKKLQSIESQMPLLDGVRLRLDHYATMMQAHDEQLRYTADKRELTHRIDDLKENQEARIKALFIEISQEIRENLDNKISQKSFKEAMETKARQADFQRLSLDFLNLRQFCHSELQLMVQTLNEDLRNLMNPARPSVEQSKIQGMLQEYEERQKKAQNEEIDKLRKELQGVNEQLSSLQYDLKEAKLFQQVQVAQVEAAVTGKAAAISPMMMGAQNVISESEEDELDNLDRELQDEINGGSSFDELNSQFGGGGKGLPQVRRLKSNDNYSALDAVGGQNLTRPSGQRTNSQDYVEIIEEQQFSGTMKEKLLINDEEGGPITPMAQRDKGSMAGSKASQKSASGRPKPYEITPVRGLLQPRNSGNNFDSSVKSFGLASAAGITSSNVKGGQNNYTTNNFGYGQGYLKEVGKTMRVSQALRIDPKVQRRYVQAQLNEICEQLIDHSAKAQEHEHLMEHFDKYLRDFQSTLNDYRQELSKVKIDEKAFNERTEKIYAYFDGAKRENEAFKETMADTERMLHDNKTQLIRTFEKVQKETDAKFKRLMIIESQISGVKQEIDVMKVKRLKDESKQNEINNTVKVNLQRVERALEEAKESIRMVIDEHESQITQIVMDIEEIKGPVMITVADAQKENQALMRELGRAQTINRDLTIERVNAADQSAIMRSTMTTPMLKERDETSGKRVLQSGAVSVQSRRAIVKRKQLNMSALIKQDELEELTIDNTLKDPIYSVKADSAYGFNQGGERHGGQRNIRGRGVLSLNSSMPGAAATLGHTTLQTPIELINDNMQSKNASVKFSEDVHSESIRPFTANPSPKKCARYVFKGGSSKLSHHEQENVNMNGKKAAAVNLLRNITPKGEYQNARPKSSAAIGGAFKKVGGIHSNAFSSNGTSTTANINSKDLKSLKAANEQVKAEQNNLEIFSGEGRGRDQPKPGNILSNQTMSLLSPVSGTGLSQSSGMFGRQKRSDQTNVYVEAAMIMDSSNDEDISIKNVEGVHKKRAAHNKGITLHRFQHLMPSILQ
ncbi:hypothetical protein FGO68_gene16921 [Halteria grandinella]|uniref:Uncharacterized protein n=1 Tax=Halteria grandinella TaxID=5974 RepID=A0A8J8P3N4_HALGN|nr:hypothetical protein FGO68_gene16921 [Halteria grandinella]